MVLCLSPNYYPDGYSVRSLLRRIHQIKLYSVPVVARRVSGMSRSSYEPIVLRLREMGCGAIIMSGDKEEGRLIHNVAATIMPPGRGYFVRRSHPPTLVQAAYAEAAYATE